MSIKTIEYNKIVGRNIKNIRESRNINPDEFANRISISSEVLQDIEKGENDIDSVLDLYFIGVIRDQFGEKIIKELFAGVAELFNPTVALTSTEEEILKNVRRLSDEDERKCVAWLCGLIADGWIKFA